jgi:hypothetical protein
MMDKKSMKKNGNPALEGKLAAVKELRDLASSLIQDGIGGKLKGLKEIKVASNSPEGLKKGLEKAKEMVSHESPEDESMEMPEGEELESSEEEASESKYDDMLEQCETPEEIDELIKKLEDKKAKLSQSKA